MPSVGYAALIERFGLSCLPPWHESRIGDSLAHRVFEAADGVTEVYPRTTSVPPTVTGQLEFAVKHDGLDLGVMAALIPHVDPSELAAAIKARPLSATLRRLWFIYEWLGERQLDVPDLDRGNYVPLFDPARYYTIDQYRSGRQRIVMNGLGIAAFCPIVRRTQALESFAQKRLSERAATVLRELDPQLLERATSYLYKKESRTSFEIEHEAPTQQRISRFLEILRRPPRLPLGKDHLIQVHHAIVDPAFREHEYRSNQVYVSERLGPERQHIHYVAPRPADVPAMMESLLHGLHGESDAARVLAADLARQGKARGGVLRGGPETLDPVIHAAVLGFGFVYIHPFDDGNGRIHRYLIHLVLSRRNFTPDNAIIPVSAAILRDRRGYDEALESVSGPLMPLVDYNELDDGVIEVRNDTANLYRYLDLTRHAEYLYAKVEAAIEEDLRDELRYLKLYDEAKAAIRGIKDMPDRLEGLFLQLTLHNRGRLSPAKRARYFQQLDDTVLQRLEAAVQAAMGRVAVDPEAMADESSEEDTAP